MLRPEDLRIDSYRNMVENSVRITHLPTGTVAECSEHRSEIANRADCLRQLRDVLGVAETDGYVPTLGDYAEIIAKLADALGGPATGRDALPPEMHKAYYDAVDRAGLRRIARFMERAGGTDIQGEDNPETRLKKGT